MSKKPGAVHGDILLNNGRFQFQVPLHPASMVGTLEDGNLISGTVLSVPVAESGRITTGSTSSMILSRSV